MPTLDELIFDWNRADATAPRLHPVEIDDETLRDGLQSPSVRAPDVETRRQCLRLMEQLGIQRVNVGLPMSTQLPEIRALLTTIRDEGLTIRPGLAIRTHPGDFETVARLKDEFPSLPLRANAFLGSSRIRMFDEGWSLGKTHDQAVGCIEWARARGLPVMFVTEDTTRSHADDIRDLFVSAAIAGAEEICIADTAGHALPTGARNVVRAVRAMLDEADQKHVRINWHGHSDRGMSLANCFAAMEAGADVVHATVLGIGERSGNAPLDLLLVNLHLLGLWRRPIAPLGEYVDLVSRSTAVPIPASYPVFGRDAFRTATGVHAAAIAKAPHHGIAELADLVYSSVPAALVGRRQEVEVGPLSGRWNVRFWLDRMGIHVDDEAVLKRVLDAAAAERRILRDDEILAIVRP